MNNDMNTDLPASALDRSELLDVLRRTIEAAEPLGPGILPRRLRLRLPIPRPAESLGWPQPPTVT